LPRSRRPPRRRARARRARRGGRMRALAPRAGLVPARGRGDGRIGSVSLAERVKPWIRDLSPYVPGKPIEELERELGITGAVKLASNENPLGPSPKAMAAVR